MRRFRTADIFAAFARFFVLAAVVFSAIDYGVFGMRFLRAGGLNQRDAEWILGFWMPVLLALACTLVANHTAIPCFPASIPRPRIKQSTLVLALWVALNAVWIGVPLYKVLTVHGEFRWRRLVRMGGRKIAWAGMWNMLLALLLSLRSWTAFGPSASYFDGLRLHIYAGWASAALFLVHTVTLVVLYAVDNVLWERLVPGLGDDEGWFNLCGLIALLALLFMTLTSFERVRRWNFRLFYLAHWLWVPFVVGTVLHFAATVLYLLPVLILIMIDRMTARLVQQCVHKTATIEHTGSDLVMLTVSSRSATEPLPRHQPGDYVLLQFPEISRVHWHPFSIASAYENSPNALKFIIRTHGQLTAPLLEHAQHGRIAVNLRGYFSQSPSIANQLAHAPLIVCFAGGVGITALMPLIQHWRRHGTAKIRLFWTLRSLEELSAFQDFLVDVLDDMNVQLDLFITRPPENLANNTVSLSPKHDKRFRVDSGRSLFFARFLLMLAGFICGMVGYLVGRTSSRWRDRSTCHNRVYNAAQMFWCEILDDLIPLFGALFLALIGGASATRWIRLTVNDGRDDDDRVPFLANDDEDKTRRRLSIEFQRGRCNAAHILRTLSNDMNNTVAIPVLAAGPEAMVLAVEEWVHSHHDRFAFHRESFLV